MLLMDNDEQTRHLVTRESATVWEQAWLGDGHVVDCPYCGSCDTHIAATFGSTLSEIAMRCRNCRSSFGWIKWQDRPGAVTGC